MSSGVQKKAPDPPGDQNVREIIDKLKSQGLFDQFRKEFLADVDTKPAYQNLRQRVEGHVSKFLMKQTWAPTLNKNQLRESLRRHMNQSGMLSNGVERVIEQVVNPKIFQAIKPQIDEVICQYLKIDPLERQKRLEQQKLLSRPKLPCLMGGAAPSQIQPFTTPPPGNFPAAAGQYPQDARSPWQQQSANPAQFPQPPGMNFSVPPPFSPYSYPIPPQAFPYPPPGWNAGFPPFNVFNPNQPIVSPQNPQFLPPVTAGSNQFTPPVPLPVPTPTLPITPKPLPTVTQVTPPLTQTQQAGKEPPVPGTTDVHLESPFKKSLPAVSANLATLFAPVSTPLSTKAPVQPTQTPPKVSSSSCPNPKPDKGDAEEGEIVEDDDENSNTDSKVDDIPLPPTSTEEVNNPVVSATRKLFNGENAPLESVDTEDSQETGSKKVYNFAWDKEIEVDKLSEVSISSVHTSDLSYLGDDIGLSDSEPEEEPVQTLTEIEIPVAEEVQMVESESQVTDSDQLETSSEASPVKILPPPPEPDEKVSPPKPRKLIALQYNYSDSEDDETREERKARVAKEKEDRYLRRLQRRAEMEARRKDREEEKARLREVKAKQKEETENKVSTDSQESQDGTESEEKKEDETEEKAEEKDEADREKEKKTLKRRKTKAEMKEELREQKVKEKKLALRRQRTRNKRYTSDEFTSIFTEKKQPICSQSYTEVVEEEVLEIDLAVEQTVDISDMGVTEVDEDPYPVSPPTPTQDEQDIVEAEALLSEQGGIPIIEVAAPQPPTLTIGQTIYQTRTRSRGSDDIHSNSSGRPGSPYSDISDISKSESVGEGKKRPGRKRHRDGANQALGEPKVKKQAAVVDEPQANKDNSVSGGDSTQMESVSEPTRLEKIQSSQRYSTSDLYKTRTSFSSSSRRRTISPVSTQLELKIKNDGETSTPDSKADMKEEPLPKKITSERRSSSTSSRRQRSTSPGGQSSHSSRHSRSPHSERRRSRSASRKRSPSPANSTVTISSESSEEERRAAERAERERRDKTPIDYVDFGEAARRSLQKVSFGEAERRSRSGGFSEIHSEADAARGWTRGKRNFRSTLPHLPVRDTRSPPLTHRRYSSDRSQSPPQRGPTPPLPLCDSPPPMGLRSRRQQPVSPDFLEYPDLNRRPRSPLSRHTSSTSPSESISSRDRRMGPRHTRSPSPMETLSRDRRLMPPSPPPPMRTRRRSSPSQRPPSPPMPLRETRRQRPPSPPPPPREGRPRPPSPPPLPMRETRRQRSPPATSSREMRSRPPSPPTMSLRETRKSRPSSPPLPVREMRPKRGINPPPKRTKR